MAELTVQRPPFPIKSWLRPVTIAPVLGTLIFLALPWSLEHKAHAILHGLCAQRPSHTYYFGDRPLPFDARMTGIYLGFLGTMIVLVGAGAWRWCRTPSPSRVAALMALGGIMAADGFNSLLKDLALPYPYEPRNWLRVVTGAGAGLVLAVALCFLISVTLWKTVDTRKQTLESWWLPVRSIAVAALLLLVAVSGIEPLYAPVVLTLVFSALSAISTLSLVVIVIVRKMEFRFAGPRQVEPIVVPAVALAVMVMLALSISRTMLERFTGPSNLV
jgi:uncharacterized membrane protein